MQKPPGGMKPIKSQLKISTRNLNGLKSETSPNHKQIPKSRIHRASQELENLWCSCYQSEANRDKLLTLRVQNERDIEINLQKQHRGSPTKRTNSSAQIVETVGSDSTNASQNSPTNINLINYQQYFELMQKQQRQTETGSEEDSSGSSRRHRGQSIYFDLDCKQYKKCGISTKLRPIVKSKFYRKKSSLNLVNDSAHRQEIDALGLMFQSSDTESCYSSDLNSEKSGSIKNLQNFQNGGQASNRQRLDKNLISIDELHQDQRKITEKAWKANFYKYGYFRKSGRNENEVSEILEEADEDYEDNFSKIMNKALDIGNPIQTEGIEIEEIGDSDLNIFQTNSSRRGHALSEIEPHSTSQQTNFKNHQSLVKFQPGQMTNLKMAHAIKKLSSTKNDNLSIPNQTQVTQNTTNPISSTFNFSSNQFSIGSPKNSTSSPAGLLSLKSKVMPSYSSTPKAAHSNNSMNLISNPKSSSLIGAFGASAYNKQLQRFLK
eukprot:403373262